MSFLEKIFGKKGGAARPQGGERVIMEDGSEWVVGEDGALRPTEFRPGMFGSLNEDRSGTAQCPHCGSTIELCWRVPKHMHPQATVTMPIDLPCLKCGKHISGCAHYQEQNGRVSRLTLKIN